MLFFNNDVDKSMSKILNSNKPIHKMVKILTNKYCKQEIVNFFRDYSGSKLAYLSSQDELFVRGSLMLSFDCWLTSVINLMLFSEADEVYRIHFNPAADKQQQLDKAEKLLKNRIISSHHYLYLLEVINCNISFNDEKAHKEF